MRRREFIAGLGGAAAMPLAARAQQRPMPVIGILDGRSPGTVPPFVSGWRDGLRQAGYVDGRNVAIEFRWAQGQMGRLPELAAELVLRQVDVILAAGNAAVVAAKTATRSIPVVFVAGSDPVEAGLVASLNRPGGNVTGITILTIGVVGKRLELLREIAPGARDVAALINPTKPDADSETAHLQTAARTLGLRLVVLKASTQQQVDEAFEEAVGQKVGALLVTADLFFDMQRIRIIDHAARVRLPACYNNREYVASGGLLSYGEDRRDAYRQAGLYVGRILKGERPSDLPVQQPIKFELAINLKTAKTLGLTVPPTLLARADEVIE